MDWLTELSLAILREKIRDPMMVDAPGQAMTVRDVASYLNVDEQTVYRLAKRAGLPGFKVAGAWRFMRSDLDAWIDRQRQVAADQATGGRKA